MEFFKFLHCAWVYSFRVVYAVLGYACLTPKKTQKDRDYPLTSGTNPLISYILLTIFFWRQMSCLHYAGVPTTKVRKFQNQILLFTFSPKNLGKFLLISALVSKMCWIEKSKFFGGNENNKICFWNFLTFNNISWFRNVFLVSSILSKRNKNSTLHAVPWYLKSNNFHSFFGRIKDTKKSFRN